MFNRTKIIKKNDEKMTELEEETAKALVHMEQNQPDIQQFSKHFFLTSAEQVEFKMADGSLSKYILIKVPFKSLASFRKIGAKVIDHLESKFKWPVVVAVNRTIISKRAISHPSQKRPRSRTLKAVHSALLEDIVAPSSITGRTTRVSLEGKQHEKVFLDPLDRDLMEPRLEAMSDAYSKLTTHKIHFEFSKPTFFQKKKIDLLKQRKGQ